MKNLIIVRGAGDLATGTIHRLARCGFNVLALETEDPSAIRRSVSFCEAVFDGRAEIEGVICEKAENADALEEIFKRGNVALMIDPKGEMINVLKPEIVVDAIIAKKNIGTRKDMAKLVIALGPGFTAGIDCDVVIETMRGHNLGRAIREGSALPNTGVPGVIAGYGKERVIHSPASGKIKNIREIGDVVEAGEVIARIGETDVTATISGVLRGIIRDGYNVSKGLKIADIDPRREQVKNCFTISDKARSIAGGVLEEVVRYFVKNENKQ